MRPQLDQTKFHPIRHDRLVQEQVHDTYKSKHKPVEPMRCPQCGAVFDAGRWHWGTAPAGAHEALCPACHRSNDDYPAGYMELSGAFFIAHRDEILGLVRNHEERAKLEHPLQRILKIEDQADGVLVTTTDIHLARKIAEALHDAFKGELEFHYNEEESLLQVKWSR